MAQFTCLLEWADLATIVLTGCWEHVSHILLVTLDLQPFIESSWPIDSLGKVKKIPTGYPPIVFSSDYFRTFIGLFWSYFSHYLNAFSELPMHIMVLQVGFRYFMDALWMSGDRLESRNWNIWVIMPWKKKKNGN